MRDIQKEIQQKLREIEEQEDVWILHAVESGSRAWGFASPDSDYDVRFVYVRKYTDYLKLEPVRDVIEWQLDDVLDINGWDLKKALVQFHRSNATLFEWSNSPLVYRTTETWERIYDAAKAYFRVKPALHHYYGTASSTYSKYLEQEQVSYKKYFYALRPLLACRYIRQYQSPPPVRFAELMELELAPELRAGIEELLEKKKGIGEKTVSPQIPVIQEFIEKELAGRTLVEETQAEAQAKDWGNLNQIFLEILKEQAEKA